ncbi:MAG: T9SS type A sorting domain-containing protein [Flavobacteriaceae bacterium]|nr:T9SS type A sorting domain-containing protein [Flavobacteriaceae bacterium]
MKKHASFYALLLIVPMAALVLMSNSSGAPLIGVTGSPLDEANATSFGLTSGSCLACHDNLGNFNASATITTNIPSGGYALGQTYTVTVTQSSTGAADHGFQITAESAAGSKVGAFSLTELINTQVDINGRFATHTFASHEFVDSWTMYWTAPAFDVGVVTFYAAVVAGNDPPGGGTTTVDTQVAFTNYVVGGVLAVNNNQLLNFSMYPNPSDGQVTLQLPSDANKAQVSVFDYLGKSLIQKQISTSNNTIDVSNLSAGIYFVRIQTGSKVGTKKLVVR